MLAVALAACGSGDGGEASLSGPAPSLTATTVPGATATTAAGASTTSARPGTTARSGATTTTAAPSGGGGGGSATTTVPAGTPLTPAAPGTYRYDTSGTASLGGTSTPFPAVTTLIVDPASGNRQRSVRDLRDQATRQGPMFETTLDYSAAGVSVTNLKVSATVLVFTDTEELVPPSPVLLFPTGAKPGDRREVDVPTAKGATARVVIEVLRTERVNVAGRAVDTTVVRVAATLAGSNATISLTVWVSPTSRLWVKEQFVADVPTFGYHAEYTATLQRLTPG